MKTYPFLLSISLLLVGASFSCKNDESNELTPNSNSIELCGVKNPVKNLTWLSTEIQKFGTGESSQRLNGVVLYEYKGANVVEVQCGLCFSTNIHQYKCDGTLYDFTEPNIFQDYIKNRKKIELIFGTEIWK